MRTRRKTRLLAPAFLVPIFLALALQSAGARTNWSLQASSCFTDQYLRRFLNQTLRCLGNSQNPVADCRQVDWNRPSSLTLEQVRRRVPSLFHPRDYGLWWPDQLTGNSDIILDDILRVDEDHISVSLRDNRPGRPPAHLLLQIRRATENTPPEKLRLRGPHKGENAGRRAANISAKTVELRTNFTCPAPRDGRYHVKVLNISALTENGYQHR